MLIVYAPWHNAHQNFGAKYSISITDAIAAIVVLIVGIVLAVVMIVFAVQSILLTLKPI